MTVKKVGRPSKAAERRRQILAATHAVVAHEGIAGATLTRIAEQAGLQRTLVVHYFGDRTALIGAFITEAVAAYGDQMLVTDGCGPLSERIESFFVPGAYASQDDLTVWLELVALAARDHETLTLLRNLWTRRWLPALEDRLTCDYPGASPRSVESTAYALTCLFEAHWALRAQGLDEPIRQRQAQFTARTLLSVLERDEGTP